MFQQSYMSNESSHNYHLCGEMIGHGDDKVIKCQYIGSMDAIMQLKSVSAIE